MTGKRFRAVYDAGDIPVGRFPVRADGRVDYQPPSGSVIPVQLGDDGTSSALHSNSDFETVSGGNPTIWNFGWNTGGSTATETTDILFGANALTVSTSAGGGNNQRVQSDAFTVAGGDTVVIGCWAHSVTGSPLMAIGLHTAASGTPDFFDGVSFYQESEQFALAGAYTRYTKTFLIPAAHTKARFNLRFTPTAAEATSSRIDFTTSSRVGASVAILPGNSWAKEACKAVMTGPVTPAGGAPNAADGVSLAVGDRVLLADPAITAQNGPYTVTVVGSGSNGTWVRASDGATAAQLAGAATAITAGTVHGGSQWSTSFKSTDTLGTTKMAWSRDDPMPGTILVSNTSPPGWLICNGAAVSRTTYAALFAIIGTIYGVGDGSTTFNVPDMRDRFPIGYSASKAVGSTGGAATHTLTTAEMPAHAHPQNVKQAYTAGGNVAVQGNANAADWTIAANSGGGTAENTGGGGAHNNMPPYIALIFIIKH